MAVGSNRRDRGGAIAPGVACRSLIPSKKAVNLVFFKHEVSAVDPMTAATT